jgi:lipopolysaccharide transport system ATP-binding protein
MSSEAAPVLAPRRTGPVPDRDVAVRAAGVSKIYRLYARPQDRLAELLLTPFGRRRSTDFVALDDVSFELLRGRRLGVIGRNGSGKSTLLQILAGTLSASGGDVRVNGRVAALLELGSGFNPEFTGRENVYLNASILGLSREEIHARFDDIAAFADIGRFMDQPMKTYSSGMFMRLAFAVTTSVDAEILLIDEALAVGDVFFTRKCFSHLEKLIEKGTSVVLVTHDTSAVNQFCDEVLVLDRGRQAYHGDTVGGLRTYFALQRAGDALPAEPAAVPAGPGEQEQGAIIEWPGDEAFLPLGSASVQGTGAARCTAVALCDQSGAPANVFQMGDVAVFYTEFALERDIDVPICGVSIINERNLILHGRNSLQHGAAGSPAPAGTRVRSRQWIRLDVAPGRYTFLVGLASMPPDVYGHAAEMSHASLDGYTTRLASIDNIGGFSVTLRRQGLELPFHGLCQLEGGATIEQRAITASQPPAR